MTKTDTASLQNVDEDGLSKESYDEKSFKNRRSPKQVTDGCESEDTEKGKRNNEDSSFHGSAFARQPQHKLEHQPKDNGKLNPQHEDRTRNNMNGFQKDCKQKQDGSVMEDDQQSSLSNRQDITLPQHETIEPVQPLEPLDINYRSTPACLELRAALMSRLRLIAPTGRIQVVSN